MKTELPLLQTAFMRYKTRKSFYIKRYWFIQNENEFREMLSDFCKIDMVNVPEIKAYPCIFELQNSNNSPEVVEISQSRFEEIVNFSQDYIDTTKEEYEKIFFNKEKA